MSEKVDSATLVSALTDLEKEFSQFLDTHQSNIELMGQSFVEEAADYYGRCFGAVEVFRSELYSMFAKLFCRLHVSSFAELERTWKKYYSTPEVRNAVEDYLEVCDQFDKAFRKFKVKQPEDQSEIGKPGPIDIPLVNVRTGETQTIGDYVGESNLLVVLVRHFL